MTVWIMQCLCPQRHCIVASCDLAESETEAREKLDAPTRATVAELIASGGVNPWCGMCGAKQDTWRYELGKTKFSRLVQAMPGAARVGATKRYRARSVRQQAMSKTPKPRPRSSPFHPSVATERRIIMPVDVPTMDEFQALADRVTRLEQDEPEPPINPDVGMQAKRVADVVELFGVNTFSSLNEHNQWGSWPADYRPESVIAALDYMTKGTGFAFRLREYHYAGREGMQRQWLQQIVAAIPGTRVAICPGANAGTDAVPTMLALADDPACGIQWVEGLNEPNTDFGSGEVPVAQTKAIQDAVWQGRQAHRVLGPSIVAGIPHPEGWITGYCGDQLPAINAAMQDGNGHFYPPGCPELPRTGYSTVEYVDGLRKAYEHPIHLTEYHPTLYNGESNKPDQPGWSGERDAFYTLLTLLRCGKIGDVGLWWYALFDYGTSYICGLFPKCGTDAPRPAATALRNLCRILADPGPNARTFTPGRLGVTIDGLTDACEWDLYQQSGGRFFVAIWLAAKEPGQTSVSATVTFDRTVEIIEYNPLASDASVCPVTITAQYEVSLSAGVCILAIN